MGGKEATEEEAAVEYARADSMAVQHRRRLGTPVVVTRGRDPEKGYRYAPSGAADVNLPVG